MLHNVKDLVNNDQKVTFVRYKNGFLWYVCENGFEFPVPSEDEVTFYATEKALLYMRYIRMHLEFLESAKEDQDKKNLEDYY